MATTGFERVLGRARQPDLWVGVWLPFLLSRLSILLTGAIAITVGTVREGFWRASDRPWIDMWARWDSGWYMDIAAQGYNFVEGAMSHVAFFPAYPLLLRFLSWGSENREILTVAGWIISNGATLVAFYFLFRLVQLDETADVARRTIWLLAFFPTSFFLSVVYTEGLFLLLTVAAFWFARKRRWLLAGLLGALSAATRSIGAFLILPLAYEWYRQRPRSWRSALALLLIPLGLAAYMVYLDAAFGNPMAFSEAVGSWGRISSFGAAIARIEMLLADPALAQRAQGAAVDLAFVALGIGILIAIARKQRPSYTIYTAYALLVPLATLLVVSMPRYVVVAFPVFIAMAQLLAKPRWFRLTVIVFALLQIVFVVRWSLWYWVA